MFLKSKRAVRAVKRQKANLYSIRNYKRLIEKRKEFLYNKFYTAWFKEFGVWPDFSLSGDFFNDTELTRLYKCIESHIVLYS